MSKILPKGTRLFDSTGVNAYIWIVDGPAHDAPGNYDVIREDRGGEPTGFIRVADVPSIWKVVEDTPVVNEPVTVIVINDMEYAYTGGVENAKVIAKFLEEHLGNDVTIRRTITEDIDF